MIRGVVSDRTQKIDNDNLNLSILITDMVRDSVRSVSSPFFVRHTSLQNNVNGGVEPWSLVNRGKTLVTKGNELGDDRKAKTSMSPRRPCLRE